MRWIQKLRMRVRMLLLRRREAQQLDVELQFHIDQQIAENIASGMTPRDARYAALRLFGNPTLLGEQSRATWSWNGLESLLHDLRYAMRTLCRAPGFAAIAIVVMALGIGANIALFTVVRSVLLKPLPYRDADRLVAVYEQNTGHQDRASFMPVDAGSFWEWQRASHGAAELAMVSPWQNYNVSAGGGKLPEKVDAAWCSWNFFATLGVQPALGRAFTAEDDRPGAAASVLLTYPFWKRRYGGDPAILGKTIWLDAKPYTVIGILPSWFVYSGAYGGNTVQLWTPVAHEAPPSLLRTFEDHEFQVIARLLPGASLSRLVDQLSAVQKTIVTAHPAAPC